VPSENKHSRDLPLPTSKSLSVFPRDVTDIKIITDAPHKQRGTFIMSANANGMITFDQHMQTMRENNQLVRDLVKTFTDASIERDALLFANLRVPDGNLPKHDEVLRRLKSPREASVQQDQVSNGNDDNEALNEARQPIESTRDSADVEKPNNSSPLGNGSGDRESQAFNASAHDRDVSPLEQERRTSQAPPNHSKSSLVASIFKAPGDGASPLERRRQAELKRAYAREAEYQAKRLREGSPPRLIDRSVLRGPSKRQRMLQRQVAAGTRAQTPPHASELGEHVQDDADGSPEVKQECH
jgi:hypothetical protein